MLKQYHILSLLSKMKYFWNINGIVVVDFFLLGKINKIELRDDIEIISVK